MHANVWLDRWMSQGFKYLADTAEVKLSAKLKSGVKGFKNLVAIIKIQVDNKFYIFNFTSCFILIQISYVYVRAENFFFFTMKSFYSPSVIQHSQQQLHYVELERNMTCKNPMISFWIY